MGFDFDVPFCISEETPKQKPLHFVTDYAILDASNYALQFGEAGLMNTVFGFLIIKLTLKYVHATKWMARNIAEIVVWVALEHDWYI